jgi:hypothetical protein
MISKGAKVRLKIRHVLSFSASLMPMLPLSTAAQTQASVDASVGAIAASNPYLIDGGDTAAVGVNVTISPRVTYEEEDTTFNLNGSLNLESFFDKYDLNETVTLGAGFVHDADERTTIAADVRFMTSESAARRFYQSDVGELEPGEFPESPVIDPTLGNFSGRSSRIDANARVERLVSSNAVLAFTAGFGRTQTESGTAQDYRDSHLGIRYSRDLNERTSLTLTADGGYVDYLRRRAGDGIFTNTLVGAEHQITETMYGSAQIGLSYSLVDTLLSGNQSALNWAASLNLCDMFMRGTLCVSGSRGAQPTSLGGITMVSSLSVSYSRSIGEDSNLSFGANYSRSGTSNDSLILLSRRRSEIANVSGTYSHRLGGRLSAFISPGYTANNDDFYGRAENFEVLAGITYHFGPRR